MDDNNFDINGGEINGQPISEIENEIADFTGIAHGGVDYSEGTGADYVHDRRVSRGQYRDSDFESRSNDPIENHSGPVRMSDCQTFEQWQGCLNYRENLAREKYPDYDEIVDKYVRPYLNTVDRAQLQQILLRDDVAEVAYKAGKAYQKELRSRVPTKAELDAMQSGDELQAWLDEHRGTAMSADDEQPEVTISKRQMKAMNRMDLSSFAQELDRLHRKGW